MVEAGYLRGSMNQKRWQRAVVMLETTQSNNKPILFPPLCNNMYKAMLCCTQIIRFGNDFVYRISAKRQVEFAAV